MKDAFIQIPKPLQKQIIFRLGYGIMALFVALVFLFSGMDFLSVLSCVAIMAFFAVNAFFLFSRAVFGGYVVIRGECTNVDTTAFFKKTKAFTLRTEDAQIIKVVAKQRLGKIAPGMRITLYVASNMQVYQSSHTPIILSYMAADITAAA